MRLSTLKRSTSFLSIFLAVLFSTAVVSVYATPPTTKYTPGETLDPSCSPGDTNCSVSTLNIGDEVGSGNAYSVLFIDASGDLAEDNASFLYGPDDNYLYTGALDISTTTSSTGYISQGSSRLLHTYKASGATNDNLFVGLSAGNFTITSTTSGNVGLGGTALNSLTSGSFNTAAGYRSMQYLTTGGNNVAMGLQSLRNNRTASDNIAIGSSAMYGGGGIGTLTGGENIGIGTNTLYSLSSGTDNVAVGYEAGSGIATGSRNVFIGGVSDVVSGGSAFSDSIGIGYDAAIRGSNQMVIGSETSSIANIYFGEGVISATPADSTLNVTGGSGTDIAGADLGLASGKATGNAVGGDIVFYTSDAGSSGTTLQSLTEKMRLFNNGTLALGNSNSENYNISFSDPTGRMENVITGYGAETQYKARYANGSQASPTQVLSGDALAVFGVAGYDSSGSFTSDVDAGIKFVAGEDWTSSAHGNKMIFAVKAVGSNTLTKIMSLDSTGLNVGAFGNHSYTLDVAGDANLSSGSVYRIAGTQIAASNLSNGTTGTGSVVLAAAPTISGSLTLSAVSTGIVTSTAGVISSVSQVPTSRGGTNISTASSTGVPVIVSGTWSVPTTFVYDTGQGFLGIGDSTPDFKLDVETDTASSAAASFFNDGNNTNRAGIIVQAGVDDHTAVSTSTLISFRDGDGTVVGSVTFGSSATAYNTTSDERLKTNIVDTSLGIDDLMQVQVRDFTWKADKDSKLTHGFIAQELYDIYPSAVTLPSEPGGYWMVDYSKLMPLTIKAIQDVHLEVIDLQSFDIENTNSLGSKLIAWFADTANGIQDFFAKRVTVEELCVGSTCITETDLQNLMNGGQIILTTPPPSSGGGDTSNNDTPSDTGDESGSPEGGDTGDTGEDAPSDTNDTGSDTGEDTPADTNDGGEDTGDTGSTDGGDTTPSDTSTDAGGSGDAGGNDTSSDGSTDTGGGDTSTPA